MKTERRTVRLSSDQIAAVKKFGGGSFSRGIREWIATDLGVGSVDRSQGFATLDTDRVRELGASGGNAKAAAVKKAAKLAKKESRK